ncbi:MAG: hypothetical protein MUD08_04950 [Cytophagales bacterium]|nr:hypothetical protein [Cytophagales bacterium]
MQPTGTAKTQVTAREQRLPKATNGTIGWTEALAEFCQMSLFFITSLLYRLLRGNVRKNRKKGDLGRSLFSKTADIG